MPETTVGHTPGPWTFPLLGLRGPDGRAIDTGDNDEPASSNRRLIAASPNMLGTLRIAEQAMEDALAGMRDDCPDTRALVKAARNAVLAQIKEATGGVA